MDEQFFPPLKFLHSLSSLIRGKLDAMRRIPTDELKSSLLPGTLGALKTREDGTILDGNHRVFVLKERGENVDSLPREIIKRDI
jgi:hypothetical protein